MTKTRIVDPVSGLTFDVENYTGPIGPPIAILAPFAKTELTETNDYMTRLELMQHLDTDDLPDVISVCDGEWRKPEHSKLWRFWTISERADIDDGFDEQ